jgi:hypothetical protein
MKKDKNQIQEEALLAILPHNRCGVGISMGVGKTLIGLQHMNKNYTDYCETFCENVCNTISSGNSASPWIANTPRKENSDIVKFLSFL